MSTKSPNTERVYVCRFCDFLLPPGEGIVVWFPHPERRKSVMFIEAAHCWHSVEREHSIEWRLLTDRAEAESIEAAVAELRRQGWHLYCAARDWLRNKYKHAWLASEDPDVWYPSFETLDQATRCHLGCRQKENKRNSLGLLSAA